MSTKEGLDYAWKWFEYHAGQRLVAFRFVLVILGALLVGLTSSLKDRNVPLASLISGIGLFISFAFLTLEIRNEQLVNLGRAALRAVEGSEDFQNLPLELRLLQRDQTRRLLLSHKFWFIFIYVACMVVFLFLCLKPTIGLGQTSGNAVLSQMAYRTR